MCHIKTINARELLQPLELDDISQDTANVAVLEAIMSRLDRSMGREDALLADLRNRVGQRPVLPGRARGDT